MRGDAEAVACLLAGTPERVASIEDIDAGGVRARLYSPRGGERDAIVWFHGGGWIVGELHHHDPLASALANHAGCAVLSVEYRLAPEHPYPAAIEDCWAATRWASGQFDRVAVGGDSAGGNLAAAVALRARDAALPIALQLLVYPTLDARLESSFITDFIRRYTDFAGQTAYGADSRRGVKHVWETYIPDPARRIERDASPACATSLAGVAPAVVILAEHDILRGEGEAYAERLRAEGVTATVHVYEGQVHGFYHLVGTMSDARDAVRHSGDALRQAFGRPVRRYRAGSGAAARGSG